MPVCWARIASTTSEGGSRRRISSTCEKTRGRARKVVPQNGAHRPAPKHRERSKGEALHSAGPYATSPVNPTTSFLTATALAYAIGAGITAAAGTRLALQLLLIDGFEYHPLQAPHVVDKQSCYFSSLPHHVG